jgi:hypothetical protein
MTFSWLDLVYLVRLALDFNSSSRIVHVSHVGVYAKGILASWGVLVSWWYYKPNKAAQTCTSSLSLYWVLLDLFNKKLNHVTKAKLKGMEVILFAMYPWQDCEIKNYNCQCNLAHLISSQMIYRIWFVDIDD